MRRNRVYRCALGGWILLLASVGAWAQQQRPPQPITQRPPGKTPAAAIPPHAAPAPPPSTLAGLPAYEGQAVTAVELAGWPGLKAAPILAQLPLRAGAPFSRVAAAAAIGRLRQLLAPRLQGVELNVLPEPTGLRVRFVLEPADYFGVYTFPGADRFSYPRLLEAAGYQQQTPFNPQDVTTAVSQLQLYFQQQGYFQATVEPRLGLDQPHGLVNVRFDVTLGPLARYGVVHFPGATPEQAAYLGGALSSFWARLRRASVRTGAGYSYSSLQNAVSYLQSTLNGKGHLSAAVTLAGALYHRATNRADITFNVAAGPVVHLQIQGAFLWPWTRHSLIPIYQASRVDGELLAEGQDNLVSYFSAHGYFNAAVATEVSTASGTRTLSRQSAASPAPPPVAASLAEPTQPETITYLITKGPRHDVEAIRFSGAGPLSAKQLLAQVAIHPEGLFSHGAFNARLLRTSVANLTALYQAQGYSRVRVTPRISRPGGNLAVEFVIVPGPQDRVASLTLQGSTLPLATLAPHGVRLSVGGPFSQDRINRDRNQILASYYSRGYLHASFRATARRLGTDSRGVAVTYQIAEGPQVRTATVVTDGRVHTRQRFITRSTHMLVAGQPLTRETLLSASEQLYQPGIFDWAEVEPRRPITTQTSEDVVIKVHESPRNVLIWGGGFDYTNRGGSIPSGTVAVPGLPLVGLPSSFSTSEASFYGPSGNVEYTRLNLLGKAETFTATAYAGRLDQRGSLVYTNPELFWTRFSGNFELSAEHDSQNPIFTAREGRVSYQLERPLTADRTTNLFLRYTYSQTGLTRLLIPALVPPQDRNLRLSTFSATYLRDTRDNPLDAHKGMLESLEADYNPQTLGSSVDFGRLTAQTAYYRRIWGNVIWANSLRLGFDHAFAGSFVPLSEQFFSGGGSTLRGFPLDGAGPQETIPACGNPSDPSTCSRIQVPVGGNQLVIVNTELRIPTPQLWSGLGVALFYDGGNVFSHVGFRHLGASWSNSVGFGLRYATPVGPIRIDIGHLVRPLPGISSTQLFITLGQAF